MAVKWAIAEIDTDKALKLRDDFNNTINELLAPDFFPIEITHSLTRAERQGRITPQEASTFLVDLIHNLPDLYVSLPLLPRAYQLSSRFRIGVYDCIYVALAEREQCPLVTADEKLVGHFPAQTISLASL